MKLENCSPDDQNFLLIYLSLMTSLTILKEKERLVCNLKERDKNRKTPAFSSITNLLFMQLELVQMAILITKPVNFLLTDIHLFMVLYECGKILLLFLSTKFDVYLCHTIII